MAIPLDPKHTVSFEELLMSQVGQQEALTRLLIEKGVFTKEEFLEMAQPVDRERKKKEVLFIELKRPLGKVLKAEVLGFDRMFDQLGEGKNPKRGQFGWNSQEMVKFLKLPLKRPSLKRS